MRGSHPAGIAPFPSILSVPATGGHMLSRRELITTGVAGSLAGPASAAPSIAEAQDADRAGQREIARAVGSVEDVLRNAFYAPSLSYGVIELLRKEMSTFF